MWVPYGNVFCPRRLCGRQRGVLNLRNLRRRDSRRRRHCVQSPESVRGLKLVPPHFYYATLDLGAVEGVDGVLRFLWTGEHGGSPTFGTAVGCKRNVCAEDTTCGAKKVLKILPLSREGKLGQLRRGEETHFRRRAWDSWTVRDSRCVGRPTRALARSAPVAVQTSYS
jgi:hypothetical protein